MSFDTKKGINKLLQYLIVVVCAGIVLACLFTMRSPGGDNAIIWALATVQLLPFFLELVSGRSTILSFVMLIHFAYTCFAKIYYVVDSGFTYTLPPLVVEGTTAQFNATLIILGTHYLVQAFFPNLGEHLSERPKKLPIPPRTFWLLLIYYFLLPFQSDWMPTGLGALPTYLNCIVLIAVITCVPIGHEKQYTFLLPFLGAYLIVSYINSAMMTYVALFILLYFVANCLERKTITIPFLVIALTLMQLLQLSKHPLRALVWSGSQSTFSERATLVWDIFAENTAGNVSPNDLVDLNSDLPSKEEESLARIDEDSLSRVMEYTPSRVPYFEGSTYEQIFFMVIPRFLWPDKPNKLSGNMIGRLYGYLGENDYGTSVSMPMLAEGYLNFGYIGLYLTAMLLGLQLVLLLKLHPLIFGGNYLLTFICVLTPFLRYEEDFNSCLIGLVGIIVLLYILRLSILKDNKVMKYSTSI